ncbi:histone deacetylase complex subunit SAP30 isoform 1-T1 [Anomaloglossus baeobatrachus]|uniref:histone deacetylase complex subunit SAP30 isoform X1 n=1 Tax=Anomaloglossus baeobatrachus TaxID=238106 RepID=UPI003F4FFD9C
MNGFPSEDPHRDSGGEVTSPAAAVTPPVPSVALGPLNGQLCCLRDEGERCSRPAGNASFSKRIQKSISQKKVKIDLDKTARHLYICDFHKNLIQSVRNRRKRKGSDDDDADSPVHDTDTPEVDLFQLQVNTLRRYKRHFKLQARPGLNKAQLVERFSPCPCFHCNQAESSACCADHMTALNQEVEEQKHGARQEGAQRWSR